jgi:hypothetical protein
LNEGFSPDEEVEFRGMKKVLSRVSLRPRELTEAQASPGGRLGCDLDKDMPRSVSFPGGRAWAVDESFFQPMKFLDAHAVDRGGEPPRAFLGTLELHGFPLVR